MPDVAGGVMPGEAVADTQGPSASLQYGDRSRMQNLANSLKNDAPGAYAATQQPGGQPPAGASPPGGAPPGGPGEASAPVQPAPGRPPVTPDSVNQAFSPPAQVSYPWREGLTRMANHPQAGPYLKALAQLAQQGFGNQRRLQQ